MNQNQIAYWNHQETVRNNKAVLAETIRHNKAMEEYGFMNANAAYLNAYTTSTYAKQYADAASLGAYASMQSAQASWLRAQTEQQYAGDYANAAISGAMSKAIDSYVGYENAQTNKRNADTNRMNAETNILHEQNLQWKYGFDALGNLLPAFVIGANGNNN